MKKTLSGLKFFIVTVLLIGLTTASMCGVAFAVYINNYIKPNADIDISNVNMNLTSIVYYMGDDGEYKELSRLHGSQNRIWSDIDEIPQQLMDAFVSIEDERFFQHNGVDWKRTIGAAVNWIIPFRSGYGGGSTITQQLVKNLTSDDDFSVKRKLTEIFRALDLDERMGKDQILEMYLNTIFLGRNAYGVKTAAMTYFGKELSELSLAESAIIAGITKNPSYYDPLRFPDNIKERQELILSKMLSHDKITQEQYDEAIAEEIVYTSKPGEDVDQEVQSYFIDQIVIDVRDALMREKGYSQQLATTMVYSGGLHIYTTIDLDVQKAIESVFENEDNFPKIKAKNGEKPESSMVVMDPYTGNVLGMVGGRGEKTANRTLNRATQSLRSPGSAIKPIAVYAPAIDSGLITPYTVFDDTPYDFAARATGWPKNYYNEYRGRMTVYNAIYNSVNTIAVKAAKQLTPDESYNFLTEKLGVTSLIKSKKYANGKTSSDIALAPMALGGLTEGISTLELTAAYAPFGNGGVYYKPRTFVKVLDSSGTVLIENGASSNVAFENEKTYYYMLDSLKGVLDNPYNRRAKISGFETIGKTGTTSDDFDTWFAGLTPYYVGACWFGYDTPQTIKGVSSNQATILWTKVMTEIHKGKEKKNFERSKDFVKATYCLDSGLSPTQWCSSDIRGSRVATGTFYKSDVPKAACNIHVGVEIDSKTNMLATEFCPPEDVKTIGLMDLTRKFEKTIEVLDQKYTINVKNEAVGTGIALPQQYSNACNIHDVSTTPPPIEGEGDVETPPTDGETVTPPADGEDDSTGESFPPFPPFPDDGVEVPPVEMPDVTTPDTGDTNKDGTEPESITRFPRPNAENIEILN